MSKSTITCENLVFSRHAITRMIQRELSLDDVGTAIERGEIIEDYPEDKPYPSVLLLAFIEKRPIHLVLALHESERSCIIVTMYRPDRNKWTDDYKRRRT